MKLQTVPEIRQQHPDEWALLEIVRDRKDTERVAGRLLGHSPMIGDAAPIAEVLATLSRRTS